MPPTPPPTATPGPTVSTGAVSAVLLAVCSCIVLCPWVWIAARRSTRTSAWADPAVGCTPRLPGSISASFARSLRGRSAWVPVLVLFVLALWAHFVRQSVDHAVEITIGFVCCWLTSFLVLAVAWVRLGQPHGVQLGLMANFFIQGGLMGVAFAVVLNSVMRSSWAEISPTCNQGYINMTPGCNTGAALMWVLSALVEETYKSVWLFLRLRRVPEDLPGTCCICLPAAGSSDCACWYKLAPTPYHVLLCALASGAGFECLENLVYVFVKSGVFEDDEDGGVFTPMSVTTTEQAFRWIARFRRAAATTTTTAAPTLPPVSPWERMMFIGFARLVTSGMHMVWTGLIGLGLARRMFLPEPLRPRLYAVILPSLLAHGLCNYAISATRAARLTRMPSATAFFIVLFLALTSGSCWLLARMTGGCRGVLGCDRCCCKPDFWEVTFPQEAREPAALMAESELTARPSPEWTA